MSMDSFWTPLILTNCRDSYRLSFRLSFLIASLDIKFVPEPVSKQAQKMTFWIFDKMMASNDRSSDLYAVSTVASIGTFNEGMSNRE